MLLQNAQFLAPPLAAMLALFFLGTSQNSSGAEPNPVVRFTTTQGDIDIELYADKAPITVKNFLNYVNNGFYDGLIFHRVIPGFVIQGGGMEPGMKQRPNQGGIENEADNGLLNKAGTLSMARTSDPHSASSQFFISLKDNVSLDHRDKSPQGWGYAVFGRVIAGMEAVDRIAATPTGNAGAHQDVPKDPQLITKASVLK